MARFVSLCRAGRGVAEVEDTFIRLNKEQAKVRGKIIDRIELSSDLELFEITVAFQDKTTLTFIIETCLVAFPVLADWIDGEEKLLKRYKPVHSKVPRT